ncbi:hypothetical protein [Klebsiella quasipneumoniae]|uniref:hypothetical protein n=1 Tax=Klebsiella quasipneumoniae TaxID=1463165 RepID=UPI0020B72EFA|nr:hypothetical protein [Klebsiella quasipneumoniae]
MKDLNDNALAYDDFMLSEEGTFVDRLGNEVPTLRGLSEIMRQAGESVVEKTRQNLIPLSRQYMTLDAAQADIANIPEGSTTYYRSPDDSALAIEVMNVGGTLESTGRHMISQEYVDALIEAITERIRPLQDSPDSLFDIVSLNGIRQFRVRDDNKTEISEIVRLLTGDSGLEFSGNAMDNNAPDGWVFVIHASNGLVIAGVKDDGTKVGFGSDNSSGGGQSGEIIPGDTAVSYDAIRDYDGEATVKDVIGHDIAGRFVVNAADTESADDGGGVLVDVLGRRWVRQCDFVSYDMFGAPRVPASAYASFSDMAANGDYSGAAALIAQYAFADAQIAAAHAFANKMNIRVVQNDGVFLWKNTEIEVRTPCNLSGATLVTTDESGVDEVRWGPYRGVDEDAPEPIRQFVIRGKDRIELNTSQLNLLNTTYAAYLKKGSSMLPMPDLFPHRGSMLFLLSSDVDYIRYGDATNIRNKVLVRDYSLIGKNGALSDQLVKTFSAGSIIYAAIIPKEDSFLAFHPPRFHETGGSRRFVNLTVERAMVNILDNVHRDDGHGESASRVVVSIRETFAVNLRHGQVEASHAYDGAYGISFRDALRASICDYYGEYGWGLNGHHGIKKLVTRRNIWNRFDVHTHGYDITSHDDEIKGSGVNMQGGGKWVFNNLTFTVPSADTASRGEEMRNGVFFPREDYSSDCDISLEINGLTVRFDSTNPSWFSSSTHSFDVVRLLGNDSTDNGSETHTPPVIRGRNITFDLSGVNMGNTEDFVFSFVRSARAEKTDYDTTAKHTYLPDEISVDGMTAINVPAGKNAWMNVIKMPDTLWQNYTGSRNPLRPDGTNVRISGRNVHSVVNNAALTRGYSAMIMLTGDAANWDSNYQNSAYSWVPDIELSNCSPVLADMRGSRGRLTVTGGVLSRFDAPASGVVAKVSAATVQLYPDDNGAYWVSQGAIAFTGCEWLNPAGGGTYSGTLRGTGNINSGTSDKFPNASENFFI